MKKFFSTLFCILALSCCLISPAQANIFDDIGNFLKGTWKLVVESYKNITQSTADLWHLGEISLANTQKVQNLQKELTLKSGKKLSEYINGTSEVEHAISILKSLAEQEKNADGKNVTNAVNMMQSDQKLQKIQQLQMQLSTMVKDCSKYKNINLTQNLLKGAVQCKNSQLEFSKQQYAKLKDMVDSIQIKVQLGPKAVQMSMGKFLNTGGRIGAALENNEFKSTIGKTASHTVKAPYDIVNTVKSIGAGIDAMKQGMSSVQGAMNEMNNIKEKSYSADYTDKKLAGGGS